jgi:hypothetical protein
MINTNQNDGKRKVMKKRYLTLGIFAVLALFGCWFGWKSYEQFKIRFIESKVENALDQSMESLSVSLPRKKIIDRNLGTIFYAPDFYAQHHTFDLYGQTLIILNQDSSVPFLKLSNIAVMEEYNDTDTQVISQTIVNFPLILGVQKNIMVRTSIHMPHLASAD